MTLAKLETAEQVREHYREMARRIHRQLQPPPKIIVIQSEPEPEPEPQPDVVIPQPEVVMIPPVHSVGTKAVRYIIKRVAYEWMTTAKILVGPSRGQQQIVEPRQVAMYIARALTGRSYPEIAAEFNRDHTTVMHGRRKIAKRMMEDKAFNARVGTVKELIKRELDQVGSPDADA